MDPEFKLLLLRYGYIRNSLWQLADRKWQIRLWSGEIDSATSNFAEMMESLFTDQNIDEFLKADAYRVGLGDRQIAKLRELLGHLDQFLARFGSYLPPQELNGIAEWTGMCNEALEVLRVLDETIGNIADELF